jgi:RNA polymerase sigma-70 factor (ECF subfamily)
MSDIFDPSPVPSLAAVVEAHYDELRAYALRKVGCPAMAADIVQDTWLRAAVGAPAEPVQNPRAYLYRVAGNIAVDRLRQAQVQSRLMAAGPPPEDVPAADPTADRVVAGREEYAILRNAVSELPARCRVVFLLYRGHGLSMREVAETLGIAPKTVENHIAKAMLHCRSRLRKAGRDV